MICPALRWGDMDSMRPMVLSLFVTVLVQDVSYVKIRLEPIVHGRQLIRNSKRPELCKLDYVGLWLDYVGLVPEVMPRNGLRDPSWWMVCSGKALMTQPAARWAC